MYTSLWDPGRIRWFLKAGADRRNAEALMAEIQIGFSRGDSTERVEELEN